MPLIPGTKRTAISIGKTDQRQRDKINAREYAIPEIFQRLEQQEKVS